MPLRTSSQGSLFFKNLMSGPDISSQDIISSDQSSHGISNSSRNVCFLQSPSDHRRSVLLPSSPSPSPSPSSASASASASCSSLCRTRSDGASLPFSYALLTINADHRKQELASSSSYGTKLGNGRERRGGRQRRSSSDSVQKRSVCESAKNMSFVCKQTISEGHEKDDDDDDMSRLEKQGSLSVDRSDVLSMVGHEDISEEKHGLLPLFAAGRYDFVQNKVRNDGKSEEKHSLLPSFAMNRSDFVQNKGRNDAISEEKHSSVSLLAVDPPDSVSTKLKNGETMQGFTSEDGEVFSSLSFSSSGVPLACNGKGCRPLTLSERNTLGFLGSNHGSGIRDGDGDKEISEAYFQNLLQSDPQNPLLLRNYAQFLSEEKGDFKRSEEYYERAILAEPNDGEVLSQYAQLQWNVHGDKDRAETYYNQAIEAAPEDCYVMASYASFLWDAEEEDDDIEEENKSSRPAMPVHETLSSQALVSTPLLASV